MPEFPISLSNHCDKFYLFFILEIPTPSIEDIGDRSISLNWDEPPPELLSDPPRNITQYAVTLTPQDGGPSVSVFVPAEAGTNYEVTGLKPEAAYDIEVLPVIFTEGQGEATFDMGITLIIQTSMYQDRYLNHSKTTHSKISSQPAFFNTPYS